MPIKTLIRLALVCLVLSMARTESAPNLNNLEVTKPKVAVKQTAPAEKPQKEVEPKPQAEVQQERPAPVAVQAVAHPVGCENYRSLVSQHSWNVDVALNVMRAESGCNPNAVGDNHLRYIQDGIEYGMSCGMFQVRFLPGRPSCAAMQNPSENITYAYQLYASGGWRHWSVCNKGIVSCF